ncbi:MAG: hypothetical protein ACFBSE_14680 [Prochloraceae cyanobacterium]
MQPTPEQLRELYIIGFELTALLKCYIDKLEKLRELYAQTEEDIEGVAV